VIKIVDEISSEIGYDGEVLQPIHSTHNNMVRFESDIDRGFENVVSTIKKLREYALGSSSQQIPPFCFTVREIPFHTQREMGRVGAPAEIGPAASSSVEQTQFGDRQAYLVNDNRTSSRGAG